MNKTKIEWTHATWNPTTGCDQVSAGCDHCYALTMAKRLKAMGMDKYQADGDPRTSGPGFGVTVHPEALEVPFRWRRPRRIFVNSMSDLFHSDVPTWSIASVWAVMASTPRHTYQILTKRHARMRVLLEDRDALIEAAPDQQTADILKSAPWPLANVWLGVSAEDQRWADIRIPTLLETPAAVRFVSCEPLLSCVDLTRVQTRDGALVDTLTGHAHTELYQEAPATLDWVIVGGESGPGARPMHPDCARELRDQCQQAKVAFLFKQWGNWAPACCEEESRPTCRWVSRWDPDDGPDRYVPGAPMRQMGFAHMHNVGKARAGRALDGRTWDEYPREVV